MRVLLCVLITLAAAGCSPRSENVANPTNPDVVGTWVVDPKTYDPKPMPKDFGSFALKVNADGTCQAIHVPAHVFFYRWPAQEALSGKWKLKYDSHDDAFYFSLNLSTVNGELGGYSTVLYWKDGYKSGEPPKDLFLQFYITPEPGNSRGSMQFSLIRQK